jgi:hypothetical protein
MTKPLSSHRGAITTLRQWRPCFARIPNSMNGKQSGMTTEAHLFFEVNHFKVVGNSGEPVLGSPRDVELEPEVSDWVDGLRQGSGCVHFA